MAGFDQNDRPRRDGDRRGGSGRAGGDRPGGAGRRDDAPRGRDGAGSGGYRGRDDRGRDDRGRDDRGAGAGDRGGYRGRDDRGAGAGDRGGYRGRDERAGDDRGGYRGGDDRGAGGYRGRDDRSGGGDRPTGAYRGRDDRAGGDRPPGGFRGRDDRGSSDRGGYRGRDERGAGDRSGYRGNDARGTGGFRGRDDRGGDRPTGGFRGRDDRSSGGFRGRDDRGGDRPTGGFRGRDDRSGGYRGGDDRSSGGFRGRPDRDARSFDRRSDDRDGFVSRDDDRGRFVRRDDSDRRPGAGGRDDQRGGYRGGDRPRDDRGAERGGYQGRDSRGGAERGGYQGRDSRGGGRDDQRGGYRGRDDRGATRRPDDRGAERGGDPRRDDRRSPDGAPSSVWHNGRRYVGGTTSPRNDPARKRTTPLPAGERDDAGRPAEGTPERPIIPDWDPADGTTTDSGEPDLQEGGERLQKVIAAAGVASRRVAENLIAEGRVTVNGEVADMLGRRVDPDTDEVAVDGVPVQTDTSRRYVVLNKPTGVVSSMQDEHDRPDLSRFVDRFEERLFNVGRLDYDTAGLLILTNDGALAHVLAHPSFGVTKTYVAKVDGTMTPSTLQLLLDGIDLEDGPIAADKARLLESSRGESLVEITLHSGRNRIVRRMLEAVGHPVLELVRRSFGPLQLGSLAPGQVRELTTVELGKLLGIARTAGTRTGDEDAESTD
ncbi:pseudouridine synthase [Curtobacterium sp. MCBD17_021]|nr:pseudouridine synthase [Curtobacterium sp. MCBD17_021]